MLVLASSSPRRADLLRNAGLDFEVATAQVPEVPLRGESAADYARRLAREKAGAVFRRRPTDLVLGADTIVVAGDELLEKPRSADDAARMLRRLSGRGHQVMTAVCLVGPGREHPKFVTGWEDLRLETTRVYMAELTDEEIAAYVATGEPMDKAGAYAIQGQASRWVARIEGCYFNVVGLPVPLVYKMLREHGGLVE
jgi:septum formation protein